MQGHPNPPCGSRWDEARLPVVFALPDQENDPCHGRQTLELQLLIVDC